MPKLIVLDADGVLIDSGEEMLRGHDAIFLNAGLNPMTPEFFRANFSAPHIEYYRQNGVKAGTEQIYAWYWGVADHEKAPLFSSVPNVLQSLRSEGVALAVLSGHSERKLVDRFRQAGIEQHFHYVKGDCHDKVAGLTDLLRQFDFPPSEAWYVGDCMSDMQDALKAGLWAIGITTGNNSAEALRRAKAHHVIDSLIQLPGLVGLVAA